MQIPRWLTRPTFEEERENQQADLLHSVVLFALALIGLLCLAIAVGPHPDLWVASAFLLPITGFHLLGRPAPTEE